MFEVSGWCSVPRANRPTIIFLVDFFSAQIDHRLDSYHQSILEFPATPPLPIIRYLWSFMKFLPNSVSDQVPHYTILMFFFGKILNGISYITEPVAGYGFFYTLVKRFSGNPEQFHYWFIHLSDRKSIGRISIITFRKGTAVYRNDVSLLKYIISGNTVYDNIIIGNTQRSRKSPQSFKAGLRSQILHHFFSSFIYLAGCHTWF